MIIHAWDNCHSLKSSLYVELGVWPQGKYVQRLRMLKNKVHRRIFGPKREEATGILKNYMISNSMMSFFA
jgi:hypothetical protein